jgi:hypothetical protein
MAETRTSRFGLVQWGVGTDSPSRLDFNEAFLNLENRAAYDDGVSAASLPVTNVVAGRYAMVAPGGANKTLYRRSDGGAWDFAGGNTDPDPFYLRPYKAVADGGPARSTAGLILTHPDNASGPGASVAYDGSISAGGTLHVYDVNDAAGGSLIVGTGVTANPATLGRVHVRTRADGERGLVLRPHGTGAGPVLAVQTSAGSDVLTLDATGQLQQRASAAFGGASVSAAAALMVAPTSGGADTAGLVLHGQASPADTKSIFRVLRQSDSASDLINVGRDAIAIGVLPWGSSSSGATLALAARQLSLRATGYTSDALLLKLTRSDVNDPANASLDEPVLSLSRTSSLQRVPAVLTQALGTGAVNLTLKRYTDLTQRFLELHRMGSGESIEVVGGWDSEGRVLAGTRWAGTGVVRDARQALRHRTQWNHSDLLNPGDTLTKVFATMQCRSATACDLAIDIRLQAQVEVGAFSDREDGQQWFLNCDISVNGGAFSFLGSYLFGGPSHRTGTRPINVQTGDFALLNVPAGATFQVRTRVFVGGAVPNVTTQAQFVNVQESIVTNYTTS